MSKVTVLGAAGGLGRAVTAELIDRDHDVTAVSRDGESGGERPSIRMAADLLDLDQVLGVCAGADVVVLAANVPYRDWPTHLPRLVEHAIAGATAAGSRLVMVDNLYAYGSPGTPITEATPEAATSTKGVLRRVLGEQLLAAHHQGRTPVTIGRLSDYYGPGGTNSMVYVLGIERALRGRAPRAMVAADQPHTFVYLPDAARGIVRLVERPDADGRVWILPAAPAITQRKLLTLVAQSAGLPPRIGRVGKGMLALGGLFDPQIRQLRELTEQWDRPYVTDATRFETELGAVTTTSHSLAVAETVASFRD